MNKFAFVVSSLLILSSSCKERSASEGSLESKSESTSHPKNLVIKCAPPTGLAGGTNAFITGSLDLDWNTGETDRAKATGTLNVRVSSAHAGIVFEEKKLQVIGQYTYDKKKNSYVQLAAANNDKVSQITLQLENKTPSAVELEGGKFYTTDCRGK